MQWIRSRLLQIFRIVTCAWTWCGQHRGLVVLWPAGLLMVFSKSLDRRFHTGIEYWFILAGALTNAVAFWDLIPQVFGRNRKRPWWVNTMFFFLFLFLVAILGINICLTFGKACERPAQILMPLCLIMSMAYMAFGRRRKKGNVVLWGVLLALILSSLPMFRGMWASIDAAYKARPWWPDVRPRLYPSIYLFFVPLFYCIVDHSVARHVPQVRAFLFLDRSLLFAGTVCAISGLWFASVIAHEGSTHDMANGGIALYEAGAGAVILLLGNSWYLSIRRQQEQHEHLDATTRGPQTGDGQN